VPAGAWTIETDGVEAESTDTGIWLLVALSGDVHTLFDVITTLTMSPLLSVDVVNVAAFGPVLTPLICH
jgi:hypothetical protein